MKTTKQQHKQKQRKRIFIIVVAVIIIAMAFAYVVPLTAMAAPETPPPDNGTDWDYDDSTLPAPWEEEEEEEEAPTPVLLIISDPPKLEVEQEFQIQIIMENFPENALQYWESSNKKVAGVDADGRVKAIAPGFAEVTVKVEQMRASILITVNEPKAARIVVVVDEEFAARTGDKSYELKVGAVVKLSAKIEPKGAKVDKITWKLGNDRVATLTQNGQKAELVATDIGQTQVTVTADGISGSVNFDIIASGIPTDRLMEYIVYGAIIVIAAIVAIVVLSWLAQKRKKEIARQKAAAAKRRKAEVERRMREEAEAEKQKRERLDPRSQQIDERLTMRVSGAVVGAGIPVPRDDEDDQERPVTLDDLD